MTRFRKSLALMLVVWLAIVGQIAAGGPLCLLSDEAFPTAEQNATPAQPVDDHCAKPDGKQDEKAPSPACDACGACPMAGHALPPLSADMNSGPPNRVYVESYNDAFVSHCPEQPQHVPLPSLVS